MKDSNMKTPIAFYAGLILLFFVLLSFNMTGGLYARYASDDDDGDGARTAKFEIVTAELDALDNNPEHIIARVGGLTPGSSAEIDVSVSNRSEVAVKYSVKAVNLTNNLPISISATSASLAPNTDGSIKITVIWPNSTDTDKAAELAGKIDMIRITFTAEQTD